jgi:anti-anti-sigma factor
MANANKRIELDCAKLEYICSLGLRGLLQLKKESAAKGGNMILTHVEGEVQKILTLTGFNRLLDIR